MFSLDCPWHKNADGTYSIDNTINPFLKEDDRRPNVRVHSPMAPRFEEGLALARLLWTEGNLNGRASNIDEAKREYDGELQRVDAQENYYITKSWALQDKIQTYSGLEI